MCHEKPPVASGVDSSMEKDTAAVLDGFEDERHLEDLVFDECGFHFDSVSQEAEFWNDVSGEHLPDVNTSNNLVEAATSKASLNLNEAKDW